MTGDLTYTNSVAGFSMGKLVIGASPETTTLGSDLIADLLTINSGDKLVTNGYGIDIAGTIYIDGTLDATAGTGGNSIIQVGGDWLMDAAGVFIESGSTVIFDGTDTDNVITSSGEAFNDVFFNDGLVGYWKLDEVTVTADEAGVIDFSRYGNMGTWKGGIRFDGNKPDLNFVNIGSAYFDGSGDCVVLEGTASGGVNPLELNDNFTISIWVNFC